MLSLEKFPAHGLAVIRCDGALRRYDVFECLEATLSGPEDLQRRSVFLDLSGMTFTDVNFIDWVEVSQHLQDINDGADRAGVRIAIFAPGTLGFGVARMCQQLMELCGPYEFCVTRVRSVALAFLDLNDLPARPEPEARINAMLRRLTPVWRAATAPGGGASKSDGF